MADFDAQKTLEDYEQSPKMPKWITWLLLSVLPVLALLINWALHSKSGSKRIIHSPEQASAKPNHVFIDPAGYTMVIPTGWNLTDHTRQKKLIRADISKGQNAGVQIRLQRCKEDQSKQLMKASRLSYQSDMSRHWGGDCSELDAPPLMLTTRTSSHHYRLNRRDGQTWFLQLILIYHEGKLISMQGGCLWNEREDLNTELTTMAMAIRF